MYPAVYQSRLADLSTKLAVHFFTERSMNRFCEKVLDELIQGSGARTGAFVLFDPHTSEVKVVAGRNANREDLEVKKLRISRSILTRIQSGEPSILVEDALSDDRTSTEESVRNFSLRSVLAVSLQVEDYLAGAFFLENEAAPGVFDEKDRHLLVQVARLITVYLDSAFRLREEIAARRKIYSEIKGKTQFDGIVGSSPKLLRVLETVEQVGPSDATVIIEGESGTGKELVARAIHKSSPRAHRPFVVVNCAAIPDALLESELFGHERGAFTGAVTRQLGRFEQADKSTVFLDEIGELSLRLQAKLLRFLQSQEIERLGGTKTIQLDVRLVSATNRDIAGMVEQEKFREDLYYRLNVIPITVPALRERSEDVPLLVDHFLEILSLQSGMKRPEIDPDVYDVLQAYEWPGNIRELENLMQRLVVLCKSARIDAGALPSHITQGEKVTLDLDKNPFRTCFANLPANWPEIKRRRKQMQQIASAYIQKLEDQFIDDQLEKSGGNISLAAQQSGMHRTLIHRRLKSRSQ
jgi:transcriptional regulator with GAF, ATPase, and Fis domain